MDIEWKSNVIYIFCSNKADGWVMKQIPLNPTKMIELVEIGFHHIVNPSCKKENASGHPILHSAFIEFNDLAYTS